MGGFWEAFGRLLGGFWESFGVPLGGRWEAEVSPSSPDPANKEVNLNADPF